MVSARFPSTAAATRDDAAALEVRGLAKYFAGEAGRVEALRGVDLRVRPGRMTGLVGPDGAGKTTLLRCVAGLFRPDRGEISVYGRPVLPGEAGKLGVVGYMPQRFGLYEDLSVQENLDLYADLNAVPRSERAGRFEELLRFTALDRFTRRLAGRLSGGMKQKLGLACTLIARPRLLLLDEPSVGVDPVSRRELYRIVRRLIGDGMAVVWTTAYLDEAEQCDEVVLLNEGEVLASGGPSDLTAALENATFVVPLGRDRRREAQRRATRHPSVLDALIQGHNLRLVLHPGSPPPVPGELGLDGPVRSVPPRFEDVFVTLLRGGPRDDPPARPPDGPAAPVSPPVSTPRPDPPPDRPTGPSSGPSFGPLSGPGPAAVIEADGLTRDFGAFRAVDRVSFTVAAGEVFGLLGPNGAGKSTTFRMLCGLLAPSAGTARVGGVDLGHAAARAREKLGYMSQKFSLYANLSVQQNLTFFAGAYGLRNREAGARIADLLDDFDLVRYRGTESGQLPLGYKQRLSLACALIHRPEVLFLDEPTSGVDPLTRREFWDRINRLAEAGVTVLVTSHFMDEAEYCDRLAVVYRGRMIATGAPHELKAGAASADRADPTLEDAFIGLIERYDRENPL